MHGRELGQHWDDAEISDAIVDEELESLENVAEMDDAEIAGAENDSKNEEVTSGYKQKYTHLRATHAINILHSYMT